MYSDTHWGRSLCRNSIHRAKVTRSNDINRIWVRGARGVKMEKVVLKAEKRDVIGKQVKAMRRAGKLPAVIYGRHTEPININLDAHSASLALGKLTSSSLVTINVDGTEYPALVREKQ